MLERGEKAADHDPHVVPTWRQRPQDEWCSRWRNVAKQRLDFDVSIGGYVDAVSCSHDVDFVGALGNQLAGVYVESDLDPLSATGAPGVKNPGRSACPAATAGGHRVRRIKYTDPTDRARTDRGVRVALESSMPMRRRPGNGSLTRAFNIAALCLPVISCAAISRRASDIRNVRTVCTVCAAATAPVYGLSGSAFRWAGAQIRSLPPADAAAASTAAMSYARPRCASGRPRAIPDLLS